LIETCSIKKKWKSVVLDGAACIYMYLTEYNGIGNIKMGFLLQFVHRCLLELEPALIFTCQYLAT